MRIKITFLALILSVVTYAHPLHFSVTNIDFNNHQVNLSIKVFAKDMIQHLALDNTKAFETKFYENSHKKGIVNSYVSDNFSIEINKKRYVIHLKDIKVEGEDMYLNYAFEFNDKANKISIRNSILGDCFHDQNNLVIINYNGKQQGIELNEKSWEKDVNP